MSVKLEKYLIRQRKSLDVESPDDEAYLERDSDAELHNETPSR